MIRRTLWTLGLAVLMLGCFERPDSPETAVEEEVVLQSSAYWNRPRKLPLTEEANQRAASWQAFMDLDRSFDVMSRSANEEELKLAVKDLLEKDQNLEKQAYPGEFDRIAIKSRQLVMRTYMLRLQWELDNRDSVTATVDALSEAYNAMRLQLNNALKYPLDTLQFLEE